MVLVRHRESGRADERFRRRQTGQGHDLLRPGPGLRGRMGIFFPGGNRTAEAKDVGDSKERFGVCGEEKKLISQ